MEPLLLMQASPSSGTTLPNSDMKGWAKNSSCSLSSWQNSKTDDAGSPTTMPAFTTALDTNSFYHNAIEHNDNDDDDNDSLPSIDIQDQVDELRLVLQKHQAEMVASKKKLDDDMGTSSVRSTSSTNLPLFSTVAKVHNSASATNTLNPTMIRKEMVTVVVSLEDLPEDLQIVIYSYLNIPSWRSLMSSCTNLRSFFMKARTIETLWMPYANRYYKWNIQSNTATTDDDSPCRKTQKDVVSGFVDDLQLPCAASETIGKYAIVADGKMAPPSTLVNKNNNHTVNVALLWSMGKMQPTKVDKKLFRVKTSSLSARARRRLRREGALNPRTTRRATTAEERHAERTVALVAAANNAIIAAAPLAGVVAVAAARANSIAAAAAATAAAAAVAATDTNQQDNNNMQSRTFGFRNRRRGQHNNRNAFRDPQEEMNNSDDDDDSDVESQEALVAEEETTHSLSLTSFQHPLLVDDDKKQLSVEVVQYTGVVGIGDRCIRANKPLPSPTLCKYKSHTLLTRRRNKKNKEQIENMYQFKTKCSFSSSKRASSSALIKKVASRDRTFSASSATSFTSSSTTTTSRYLPHFLPSRGRDLRQEQNENNDTPTAATTNNNLDAINNNNDRNNNEGGLVREGGIHHHRPQQQQNASGKQLLKKLLHRGKKAVTTKPTYWRPFVAPFSTLSDNDSNMIHLTPRTISYFEITILPKPDYNNNNTNSHRNANVTTNDNNKCVAIGVASKSFDMNCKMPGWDTNSYGYHSDDGSAFHGSGEGLVPNYGPKFGANDTVGCGIDYNKKAIFYTLNGKFLGYAFQNIPKKELATTKFYPIIGIDTNDLIYCNFNGHFRCGENGTTTGTPFKFDLTSMMVPQQQP